jgi:hypothetical protein
MVINAIKDWEIPSSNVRFDTGKDTFWGWHKCQMGEAIRISFEGNMLSSAIGADTQDIASDAPTMYLGGINRITNEARKKRWILHEFGHALGLRHEHQSAQSNCTNELKIDELIQHMAAQYGWNDEHIATVLSLYDAQTSQNLYTGDGFDNTSIMMYTFDAKFYQKGTASHCYAPEPIQLSAADKLFPSKCFPQQQSLPVKACFNPLDIDLANLLENDISELTYEIKSSLIKQEVGFDRLQLIEQDAVFELLQQNIEEFGTQ